MQEGKVVEYTSRALSKTEIVYAQIEKELLNVAHCRVGIHMCMVNTLLWKQIISRYLQFTRNRFRPRQNDYSVMTLTWFSAHLAK